MNFSSLRRTTVLVMQDDPLLRAGVLASLREHAAFEIDPGSIDELGADGPGIDVVIADYGHAMRLTDPSTRPPHRRLAAARIMTLTPNDREVDIRRAIESGVHGYLLLGGPVNELVDGVTAVATGVRYLCRAVAQRMADSLTRTSLTSREVEVLRLVATGESNKAIARQLQIEVGTVKSHMSAIMTKLGATSRTQAAGIAAVRGLVEERMPARSSRSMPRHTGSPAHAQARESAMSPQLPG